MSRFGDTPEFSGSSLCNTCRCSQVVKGHRFNDQMTLCRVGGAEAIPIKYAVTSCSEYDDKRHSPLWQMEKVAWKFSVDNRKKTMGFYTPTEWKSRVESGKEIDE